MKVFIHHTYQAIKISEVYIFIILLMLASACLQGQKNLIPNPSFEEYNNCQYTWGLTPLQNTIQGWSKIVYSPLYANHICYLDPTSGIHEEPYLAPALFGDAYIIMIFRENAGVSFLPLRTYMQCRLMDTLKPNSDYYISYFVSNPRSDSSPTVSHWGLHFSDEYVVEQNTGIQFGLLKRNPQIEIDTVPKLSFDIWTKYEHCFRPDSLWTVMTVGHFRENSETKGIEDLMHSRGLISYDNFFLAEIEEEVRLQKSKDTICVGECITLTSNHALIPGTFKWSLPGSDIGFSTDSTIIVCYTTPGTYDVSLEVEHCTGRYDGVFEKAITVIPAVQYTPVLDESICFGDSIFVTIETQDNVVWGDGHQGNPRLITDAAMYDFTIDNGYCSEIDSFNVRYYVIPTERLEFIVSCPEDTVDIVGLSLNEIGTYFQTLQSIQGCDSVYYEINYRHYLPNPIGVEGALGFCIGNSTRLTVTSDHKDLLWTNGSTSNSIEVAEPGLLRINALDRNDCAVESMIDIIQYDDPNVSAQNLLDIWYEPNISLPVNYEGEIDRYMWTGGANLDCNDCPYPRIISPWEGIYTIEVENSFGCKDTSSVMVRFKTMSLHYPNSIKKSSIINGIFYVSTEEDMAYILSVYDRWGNLVFYNSSAKSNDLNSGWNPTNDIAQGVYVFMIGFYELGQLKTLTGDLTVIE